MELFKTLNQFQICQSTGLVTMQFSPWLMPVQGPFPALKSSSREYLVIKEVDVGGYQVSVA